jgi:hypothetical protein
LTAVSNAVVDTQVEIQDLFDAYLWIGVAVAAIVFGAFFAVRRTCEELRRTDAHPLRGFPGRVVRRTPGGGYESEP